MIYLTLLLALIGFGGVAYFSIKKLCSRRYRIIEENMYSPIKDYSLVPYYTPQVKIGGIWYYLHGNSTPFPDTQCPNQFLDVQDALECIEKFKSAGNYTIPSNQRLKHNQKAIKVE